MSNHKPDNYFFERPQVKKVLTILFFCFLAILLVLDFFVLKHPFFGWDGIPALYALYGFLGCVMLVVIAKNLRRFLKRGEDYYD